MFGMAFKFIGGVYNIIKEYYFTTRTGDNICTRTGDKITINTRG